MCFYACCLGVAFKFRLKLLSVVKAGEKRGEKKTSAVKRLKYLIAINRIYVIVNSKLIAINREFLSILNVPSFINFFRHFIFILMPLSTWKSGLACFKQMFYFIENQHCQTG